MSSDSHKSNAHIDYSTPWQIISTHLLISFISSTKGKGPELFLVNLEDTA